MKLIGVSAREFLAQLIATPPAAYLIGHAVETWRGSKPVADALPQLFWPILAVLVLIATLHPGFIAPIKRSRREARKRKADSLRHVYWMVKHAINPEILDKSNPDRENPDKLFAVAQSTAYNFMAECEGNGWWKDRLFPQPIRDQITLLTWDEFLGELREDIVE